MKGVVKAAAATKPVLPGALTVAAEVKLYDTPVGVGSSPDGKGTYVALHDGSVSAYDTGGKRLWETKALLEGCALAVSPKGDRVAAAGYPGLVVLDAAVGKPLGGFRASPQEKGGVLVGNRMTCAAWNDAGTLVAGGWLNPDPKAALDPVVLDAAGKVVARPKGVSGGVMGAAFVPGGDQVLLGADSLTLVNARDGELVWQAPVKGAQAFAFSANGKTAAAGGWGKTAAVFDVAKGGLTRTGRFDAVVGGVALLPDGGLAVAVWGETRPLMVVRGDGKKPEVLFGSEFGFQHVRWSETHKRLLAAEQGGRLWLLGADGKPRALLSEDAGTTAYRLELQDRDVLLARMSRSVQRVRLR